MESSSEDIRTVDRPAGRRRSREAILAELTHQLATTRLSSEAILQSTTSMLSHHRPGTWLAVLLNADPSTSRVVAADDSDPAVAAYVDRMVSELDRPGRAPTSGLSESVIATGASVFIPSSSLAELLAFATPAARAYTMADPPPEAISRCPLGVIVVAMRSRGATIGTLGWFDRQRSEPLTREDVDWMQSVADRTAQAIENAQLFGAAVDRQERLEALQAVGMAVLASQDLNLNLQVVLERLCATLKVDAADVALVDDDSASFFIEASTGFHSTSKPDFRFPIESRLLGRALRGRRFETMADLESLGAFRRRSLFAREGFRTYRGVPLVARNKLLGVLEVFDRRLLEPDGEWLSFLDAMATATAIAIDHASMSADLQRVETPGLTSPAGRAAPDFTRSERAVLQLLVEGLANQAIGEQLHASESTVKFHVRRILQKVQAKNRVELVRRATREGWA